MKKLFLFLLVGFFAVVVAACSNLPTLESIELSGQDVEFYVGEEFDASELKVVAKLSDSSTEDVTDQATVSQDANMDVAGTYTVTVTYKGLTETYTITVVEDSLVSVSVENVKTDYNIGDVVSFEGAVAKETYESGKVSDVDLSTYEVVLVADGVEYTGAFAKVGKNTVKLTKGAVSYEYDVNVSANLYTSIADAVAAGVANANKVASGTAVIDNSGYVNENKYAFGKDYTFVSNADGDAHYTLLEDGSVFGVVAGVDWEGNPTLSAAYDPVEANLLGADFRAVLDYEYDVYGVEALVDTFAYIAQSETAVNYKEVLPTEISEETTYAFSFEFVVAGFYYYFVEVSFVLDADTEVFSKVNIAMNGYMFVYDEVTGEYVQPAEFGEPEFTRVVAVEQVVGAQNAENPYPLEDLLVQSFDVQDAEGNKLDDGAEISVPMQETLSLNIANMLPETANTGVDELNVTITDAEGNETWSVYGSYWDGVVTVTAYKVGVYNLTIATANVSYTFKLEVAYSELTELNAGVYNEMYYELVAASTATVYTGQVLQFGAIVNDGANPAVTATCEGATIVEGYEYLEFSAEKAGEYVITLVSAENAAFKAELTVTVKEAPSVAEILNGTYEFTSSMLGEATYVFTPESEGAVKGQLVITYEGQYVGSGEGYFSYEYAAGFLSVTPLNPGSYNCPFSVTLGSSFNLVCLYNYFEQGDLVKVEDVEEIEGALSGEYTATYVHPKNGFSFAMVLSFVVDGTGTYSLMNDAYQGTFKYASANGVITFSDVVATYGAAVTLSATITDNVITCKTAFSDAGNEIELAYVGEVVVEGEVTSTPVVGENTVFVSTRGTELTFVAEEAGTYTITVDGSVAILLIESADVWYQSTATITVEANVPVVIVVLTASMSSPEQNTTLTITKN